MSYVTIKIEDICIKVTSGGTPKTTNEAFYNPREVPWLKTAEVNYGRIYDTETYISKEGLARSSAKLIPENSVIIAMYGQGDTAGRVAINKIPLCTNQACCNLIINHDIADYEYVYYVLSTLYNKLVSLKNGGAQPNLNTGIIKAVKIPFPDLTTQQKIAQILSKYDDLIENNQKQIKLLEEAAQRLYKEWFVDLRFPGYENVKIVDGVPEGWENTKLVDIADIIMGQSPKSEFYNNERVGIPFHQGVGSYGRRFVIDEVYSTSYTRIAEENSILFSVRAPVGRLNITKNKIVIGRGLAAIKHKQGYQSYLFYLLKERFFKDNLVGNGAIFASITKNELLNQMFLVANEKLVVSYDKIVKNIDVKINALDSQIDLLVQARNCLLPKLMSGEIEV